VHSVTGQVLHLNQPLCFLVLRTYLDRRIDSLLSLLSKCRMSTQSRMIASRVLSALALLQLAGQALAGRGKSNRRNKGYSKCYPHRFSVLRSFSIVELWRYRRRCLASSRLDLLNGTWPVALSIVNNTTIHTTNRELQVYIVIDTDRAAGQYVHMVYSRGRRRASYSRHASQTVPSTPARRWV